MWRVLLPVMLFVFTTAENCDGKKTHTLGEHCVLEGAVVCSDHGDDALALSCVGGVLVSSGECSICKPHGDDTSFVDCSGGVYSGVLGSLCNTSGLGVCTIDQTAQMICSSEAWRVLRTCPPGTKCDFDLDDRMICQ